MKKTVENYWVIQDRHGKIYPLSIKKTKRDCIKEFPVHMLPDYKCIKISITFEINSNQ